MESTSHARHPATNKTLRTFLARCRVFQGLNEIEIAALAGLALVEDYEEGDIILSEGSPGDSFYVIYKGEVEISKREKRGSKDVVLDVLDNEDTFGEMALVQRRPRTATATIAEDATLLRFGFQDFDKLQQFLPDMAKKILDNIRKIMAERTWAAY